MCSKPVIVESLYRANFRGELPPSPVIKYKTLPSFYPPGSNVPDKEKMIALAPPRREGLRTVARHEPSPPTSTVEVPTKPVWQRGPKLRFDPNKVFNTKHGPMKMSTVDKLFEENQYKTSAQKHYSAEFAIPFQKVTPPDTTREEKPDMIRFQSHRYDPRAQEWQDAVLWDRLQSRYFEIPKPDISIRNTLPKAREIKLQDQTSQNEIRELVRTDKLAGVFVKKIPGHAGYLSLCPPPIGFADKKSPPAMTTIMDTSYRNYPEVFYKDNPRFARKDYFVKVVDIDTPIPFLIEDRFKRGCW